MNEIGIRIKELRDHLNLTQAEFGSVLGLSYTTIGMYENGKRGVSESARKSICREYGVDYLWLTTGEGEMFVNIPDTIIDELCLQHNLDAIDKVIIKEYVEYPAEQRAAIKNFIKKLAGMISEKE